MAARNQFLAKRMQPLVREVLIQVDGSAVTTTASATGLDLGGYDFTVAKGSGGTSNEVTLTPIRPGLQTMHVVGIVPVTTNCHCEIKSVSASSIVVETFQVADGTTGVDDANFHMTVLLFDHPDEV
jgi:hypothetical protein